MLRTFLLALASALACGASAQDYPSRPIRLIVPFAPGGGTDILIRILAPKLGAALGQQLVVENRPGASSIIGTELVARSAPDGYTLLAVDTSFTVNPSLQPKLPYDSLKDLAPVIHLAAAPVILVLHPSVPAQSAKELVALAKSQPGALAYASGGNGASTHLAGELFKMVAGIDIVHVPYKGTGPAIADVVAGQVQMNFAGISSARPFVEAGRLRAIAVTGARRNPALPDVPTFADRPKGGHGQRSSSGARLEHPRTWMHVRGDQDGAQVFRVDRLSLPAPARDLIGEGGPHGNQARAQLSGDDHALRTADQIVVGDRAGVDRVALTGFQADAVAPPDLVDEEDDFAFGERFHAGFSARIRQCQ